MNQLALALITTKKVGDSPPSATNVERRAESAALEGTQKWTRSEEQLWGWLSLPLWRLCSGEALQDAQETESESVTLKRLGFTPVKPVLFLLLYARQEGVFEGGFELTAVPLLDRLM